MIPGVPAAAGGGQGAGMDAVRELLTGYLDDPDAGWSMGAPGAIAEFVRLPGEPVTTGPGTVLTGRGGIRVDPPPGTRPVAYRTPVGPAEHWNHAVALCLPADAARRAGRTAVTVLGPDAGALRADDRDGVLVDLGLGTPTVDACVRAADPELLGRLREAQGGPLDGGLTAALVSAGPHRVFLTAAGRVEVYAAIPPPDGRSPDGPHTHLLPDVLRAGRTHAATVPVPAGYLPCAHLYPAHPLTDLTGGRRPFDAGRLAAFDRLLARFGDPAQRAITAEVTRAVHAAQRPGRRPADAPGRAAQAVALRVLAHTGADPDVLATWRGRAAPEPDLLDPGGDRNAG
ncbi:hypothetical protein C8E95_3346 [Pseudonocardia autotrophica]|uniref:Uncharacterized protein n=1 Tax=Pseudonocardia autotrophica TaxID=2074 RepID=A0A1Y2N9A1_PSEAH|nr:hypothetical protein BG845_00160 [Pseudonocardia autotrophica]TDN74228.1 hypothetical protein C8E95_3346 [Pseudonocardia autotrophica]